MKRKAVFLDRDGVIVKENGCITPPEKCEIYPYAKESVKRIKEAGYLAIVITNQSGVARGVFSEKSLKEYHGWLIKELQIDDIFYCPHHPKGIISKYAVLCSCRKPATGMIDKAIREYEIDVNGSYFVGDRVADIETGKNAGLKTVLLKTGYGSDDAEMELMEKKGIYPDFCFEDLMYFADYIKK